MNLIFLMLFFKEADLRLHDVASYASNELVRTDRCGWWIDVGAGPLAEALREAMGSTDEEHRTMGKNGRHLVEMKNRWDYVANEMANAYRSSYQSMRVR